MTARLAPVFYGMKEISALSHRYTMSGLITGIMFHFIVIGLYFALRPLEPNVIVYDYRPPFLLPPPSILDDIIDAPIGGGIVSSQPKLDFGEPVPIPEFELKAEPSEVPKEVGPVTNPEGDIVEGKGIGIPTGSEGFAGFPDDVPIDLTKTFVENIVFPQPARKVKPEYDDAARRLGLEGLVVVKLLIDKNGKPQKVEILSSEVELCNENAKKAAMQWLFTPAIANGYLVNVWVRVPFNFRLNR